MVDARVTDEKNPLMFQDIIIPDGATGLSNAVYLHGFTPLRINMPATWTTAALTVLVSDDNVTYRNLYDASGNEYTIQAAASRSIILPPADFAGVQYLKLRSGTSGTPVDQNGDRTLRLEVRPL